MGGAVTTVVLAIQVAAQIGDARGCDGRADHALSRCVITGGLGTVDRTVFAGRFVHPVHVCDAGFQAVGDAPTPW
jgi:hypothetical protein